MNLPDVVKELIKAQGNYDAVAYADCFSQDAVVFDEGNTHNGRNEIKKWIALANENYKTIMKPLEFKEADGDSILSAEISGNFEGAPVVLKYHFKIIDGLIQSLKITG